MFGADVASNHVPFNTEFIHQSLGTDWSHVCMFVLTGLMFVLTGLMFVLTGLMFVLTGLVLIVANCWC